MALLSPNDNSRPSPISHANTCTIHSMCGDLGVCKAGSYDEASNVDCMATACDSASSAPIWT